MSRLRWFVWASVACIALAASGRAQEVGTVAASDGQAEIGRGGAWRAAAPGTAVAQGDELRTGQPGHLRVVFQDDSVLTLADDAHLVVDQQLFDARHERARSLFQLLTGKVEAVVSEYYHRSGNAYDIKTATAVAGVRGTDFSMSYDPSAGVTRVVGVSGHVQVHSVLALAGPGVVVTAGEETDVAAGELPSAPRRLRETLFRQDLEGFNFVGGRFDSLVFDNPLLTGAHAPQAQTGVPGPAASSLSLHPLGTQDSTVRDAGSLLNAPPAVIQSESGRLRIGLF